MRGRKALPSRIIELRGGTRYTHRPARAQEPRPPERLPPCPRHLDKRARKEWRRIGRMLLEVRVITELDRAVLTVYCQSWSEYVRACEEIPKKQPVCLARDGYPRLNPWLRVQREACERMSRAMTELGLTPVSRTRVRIEGPKPMGKVESFMGRKGGNGHG